MLWGMASVGPAGVTGKDLGEYLAELQGVFRGALGSGLDLSWETPQGQLIAGLGRMFADIDSALVAASSRSFTTAVGYQLDDYGSLLDIRRRVGTRTVVGVEIAGDVGKVIPAGFPLQDANHNIYRTVEPYTIRLPPFFTLGYVSFNGPGYSVGSAVRYANRNYLNTVDRNTASPPGNGWDEIDSAGIATFCGFRAENVGAQHVPVDGLRLVNRILGIDAVYNKTIGFTGTDPENDEQFRRRIAYTIASNSAGTAHGIIAALTNDTTQAQRAYLLENTTTDNDTSTIIPGAIHPDEPLLGSQITDTVADIITAEAAVTSGNVLSFPAVRAGETDLNIPASSLDFSGVRHVADIALRLQTAARTISGWNGALIQQYAVGTGVGIRIYFRENLNAPLNPLSPRLAADSPLANMLGLSAAGGAAADYMPPYAIAPIVDWGANNNITTAQRNAVQTALRNTKPAGIRTYGTQGSDNAFYSDVRRVDLSVAAIITTGANFPSDGIAQMQRNLSTYIEALALTEQYNLQAMWGTFYRVPGWEWGNNSADAVPGTDFVVTGTVSELDWLSRYHLPESAVTVVVV